MILIHAGRNDDKSFIADVYAANSSRFYDTRPIKVYTDYEMADGTSLNLAVTDYTYEDSAEVERTTATTYAAGVNHQHVTIDETYGKAASYAYAAGKPKFSQAVNGVQTWHDYEATTEHGAVHKLTVTTKANGELVAAQSRKTESFIAEDETTVFTQESIWDGTQWLLLNTTAYEYDDEQRVTKTTRGNGRFSTTEWMCCGVLRETDEDGITTTYAYDSAHQLIETSRDAVYDGDVCVTPETITEYTRDAAGRVLSTTRRIGAMETTESTEYDALGRNVKQTDVLGRITTTEYSADGLTNTVTTPAGATFITVNYVDGSRACVSGTGQRAMQYSYDINGKNIASTVRLMDNAILNQYIVNGFGHTVVQAQPNTLGGFIYTRREYNAKGQMVKQCQDTGWNTDKTAPTHYEYNSFGYQVKKTLALVDKPTKDNSPVSEAEYSVEVMLDGVYSVATKTQYNAVGHSLVSVQKKLISQLSPTLQEKVITINERGLTSTDWTMYDGGTKRKQYSTIPTSSFTAETVIADGFVLSQKDTAGITTSDTRSYTAGGMVLTQTNGRGNATTRVTDIARRTLSVTDAAGNVTTTAYDAAHDLPATITDAQGNTTCYRYDERGRKVAEWGTGIQPVCFDYDDADNLVSLKTFRAGAEIISFNPSERSDGDETTWTFDPATGLELRKTYADNSSLVKTYDAYNRIATETDARGNVKSHSYEHARGLLLGTSYSDNMTTARSYAYNHLGQLTQVVDDAGTRTIGYNAFGEQETDSLLAEEDTHLITETRDAMGRSSGFTYVKNGVVQHTVNTGYGADGRIATAGFTHGGTEKQFSYGYLPGSNLLQTLTMPCNMTLTQSYESQRDLLIGMAYHRSTTLVAQRTYSYDTLGRPLTRSTARNGQTVNDSFVHNSRSELVSAIVNGETYGYDYDNIGNRTAVVEDSAGVTNRTEYEANGLNQYTAMGDFAPAFDAAGNQTLVKTTTGIWSVVYNAENRPISFTSVDGVTIIECSYDFRGRRITKKVTTNGAVTLHQRYIYRGYLQIAACDLTRSDHPCLWFITWDTTQPAATRPLAIRKDGNWFAYGWDLTKNICEVFGPSGYIRTAYTYSPYGHVSVSGNVTQPRQWASEHHDTELAIVYYNYRYYNPMDGRWLGRDIIKQNNLYIYCDNKTVNAWDYLGLQEGSIMARDDFGETCCQSEMMIVTKYVLRPYTSGHMVGHSFLQVPGLNCVGKYPSSTNKGMGILEKVWNFLLSILSVGQIQDDSDVIAECPPERIVVERTFRACPKSLEKLRSQISAYSGLYVLSNFQCDTWCDEMLRKAGADIPHVPGALFATPGVGCGAPVSKEFDSPAERKTNMDINIFKTSIPF